MGDTMRVIRIINNSSGSGIIELLISTLIASIILVGVVTSLTATTRLSADNEIITRCHEQARTVLDLLSYDIRMTGSGMPLGQTGFAIDAVDLGDSPLPILLNAGSNYLQLRLNEKGVETVLAQAYTPSVSNLTFEVLSSEDIFEEDTIYISDFTQGGANGFRGQVVQVSGNSITVSNTYTATFAASFPSGSIVTRVATITYNSPNDFSGITRNNELGDTLLQQNSMFELRYLDQSGNALALPLTPLVIKNTLHAIEVKVFVRSRRNLSTGGQYLAEASHQVGLRNIMLSR